MVATHEQLLARRDARPIVIVTIEGIGDVRGQYKFCWPKVPRYAKGNGLYKVLLTRPVSFAAQEAQPLGGIFGAGQVSFSLLDANDLITSLFAVGHRPAGLLNAAITTASSTVDISNAADIVYGRDVLFIGEEALIPTSSGGGTVVNVTRAALGTTAQAQSQVTDPEVPVYIESAATFFGRKCRVFIGFDAEDSDATSEGELEGGFWLDRFGLDASLNVYNISARSQHRHLDRLLMRNQYDGYVGQLSPDGTVINVEGGARQVAPHFQDRLFFKVGDEIFTTEFIGTWLGQQRIIQRGVGGTMPDDIEVNSRIRQVMLADADSGYGSFRYQEPGAETTSRSTGTWIPDSHPVVILLSLLSSASGETDDLSNYTTGNFSALPPGFGLGVPISEINVTSFLQVWFRTLGFKLPYLKLEGPIKAREFIDKMICQVVGYDLKVKDGQLTLDYFRAPLAGEELEEWTGADFLSEVDDNGERRPRIEVEFDTDVAAGSVVFNTITSRGEPVKSVFTNQNFKTLFGNSVGYFASEERQIEIEAAPIRSDIGGAEPELLKNRAMQLLYRFRKPLVKIRCYTDLSKKSRQPGDLIAVTHSQIPDWSTKRRGVTRLLCRILTKKVIVTDNACEIEWTLAAYGASGRFGRITPSGMISSVAGNDATIVANRYTDPSTIHGLPRTDAAGFSVGDRVRLRTRGGLPIVTAPTYQTITGLAGNVLTLDGNFGGSGSFAGGTVIEYVDRDDAVERQYSRYVFLSNETVPRTVGASDQTPWQYGEP